MGLSYQKPDAFPFRRGVAVERIPRTRIACFDIFRKDLLGYAIWIEAVADFETAKQRMSEWARRSPAEYFVFSQESVQVVFDNSPSLPDSRL